MDDKQKYENALKRAKDILYDNNGNPPDECVKNFIYNIFPELRIQEAEDTRQMLLDFVKNWDTVIYDSTAVDKIYTPDKRKISRIIRWLEEQKHDIWTDSDEKQFVHFSTILSCHPNLTIQFKQEIGHWLRTIKERMIKS